MQPTKKPGATAPKPAPKPGNPAGKPAAAKPAAKPSSPPPGQPVNKRALKVDFSGTESFYVPEGTYLVAIKSVERKVGEESGKPYLQFSLKVIEGDHKGTSLRHICSLQPQALFNLRQTLEALGYAVPQAAMTLNLDELVNRRMVVDIEVETYNGRQQSRVVGVRPVEEEASDDGGSAEMEAEGGEVAEAEEGAEGEVEAAEGEASEEGGEGTDDDM